MIVADLILSLRWVACTGLLVYAALQFLSVYRRRNDVLDQFLAYQRETEERFGTTTARLNEHYASIGKLALDFSSIDKRFENQLSNQERLAAKIGAIDAETKQACADLASKWLAEVNSIKTTQAAVEIGRPAHRPRFVP